ncbi:hypothetical protein B0T17DRAFT_616258 [Bombardia bombarda]|uniref:Uncharacterized protein n=1 Tax=Bombardia bombarda TaxID=252184 RepID=A0AA39XCB1_9PEZI|nr:hypothetical protein B0T17DRAFT_616258 [Bombardia bombarda]
MLSAPILYHPPPREVVNTALDNTATRCSERFDPLRRVLYSKPEHNPLRNEQERLRGVSLARQAAARRQSRLIERQQPITYHSHSHPPARTRTYDDANDRERGFQAEFDILNEPLPDTVEDVYDDNDEQGLEMETYGSSTTSYGSSPTSYGSSPTSYATGNNVYVNPEPYIKIEPGLDVDSYINAAPYHSPVGTCVNKEEQNITTLNAAPYHSPGGTYFKTEPYAKVEPGLLDTGRYANGLPYVSPVEQHVNKEEPFFMTPRHMKEESDVVMTDISSNTEPLETTADFARGLARRRRHLANKVMWRKKCGFFGYPRLGPRAQGPGWKEAKNVKISWW